MSSGENKSKHEMQKMMMDMCAKMSVEECHNMMQKMMNKEPDYESLKIEQNNKLIGTPELQSLFFEWCSEIRKEI